jgi:flagellin-specific chaperone FliS
VERTLRQAEKWQPVEGLVEKLKEHWKKTERKKRREKCK